VNPVEFQARFLGRKLWQKQRDIANAVNSKRKVSVKGCHGSGKTYVLAGCLPYEMLAHEESIVLTIAPTLRQVKNLWSEIHSALAALPVRIPEPTTTGWEISEKCKAIGFSSSKGVNAQGYHGKRVLIIKDEAIGISQEVHDAIDGIRMAGDVREVSLCNPTVPSGPVYEDFTRLRGQPGHECITISAFDTPNLTGLTLETLLQLPDEDLDYAPVPWLTRRRAVVEMYHKWGPNNPRFQSRVLGEFPTQASDAVFPLAWIERAALPFEDEDLKPHLRPGLYIQVGIDVAGPGDDETVATARIGPFVVAQEAWSDPDPRLKCQQWIGKLHQRFPGAKIMLLGDTVGIGYYFMRWLAGEGYDVHAFVANGSPIDTVQYKNAKAEAYFKLREYMEHDQIHGILDEDTKAQLSGCKYREVAGKIEILSKAEMRAAGTSSPDRAESLIMAFCPIVDRVRTVWEAEPVSISQY
jgi:hypothetical protein